MKKHQTTFFIYPLSFILGTLNKIQMKYRLVIAFVIVCFTTTILYSYTPVNYTPQAYDSTVLIRARTLAIMDSATTSYSLHQATVNQILVSMQWIYTYIKSSPKNRMTIAMWAKMKDTNGFLFGGFAHRRQMYDTLNPLYIDNARPIVDSAFSQILQLESSKPVKKS